MHIVMPCWSCLHPLFRLKWVHTMCLWTHYSDLAGKPEHLDKSPCPPYGGGQGHKQWPLRIPAVSCSSPVLFIQSLSHLLYQKYCHVDETSVYPLCARLCWEATCTAGTCAWGTSLLRPWATLGREARLLWWFLVPACSLCWEGKGSRHCSCESLAMILQVEVSTRIELQPAP